MNMLMSQIIDTSAEKTSAWALGHLLAGRPVAASCGTTITRSANQRDFYVYTNRYPGTRATLHGLDVLKQALEASGTFQLAPPTYVEFLEGFCGMRVKR